MRELVPGLNLQQIEQMAMDLYPNAGVKVQRLAMALISSHEYAAQYLQQAPVLILAFFEQQDKRRDRWGAAAAFGAACSKGPTLKALMKHYSLPFTMRKQRGFAIEPKMRHAIERPKVEPPINRDSGRFLTLADYGRRIYWLADHGGQDMTIREVLMQRIEAMQPNERADGIVLHPADYTKLLAELRFFCNRPRVILSYCAIRPHKLADRLPVPGQASSLKGAID